VGLGLEFFPLGRHALLAALYRFGLRAGDAIALPAYYCESTLSVLREAGFVLRFADLGTDLYVDEEAMVSLCGEPRIKAMIHVHYFGFCSPLSKRLRRACERHGIAVIEDYGHSFLSFEPSEGSAGFGGGEAYVFSMRKILPIPDGGGLIFPSAERHGGMETVQPAGFQGSIPFLLRGLVERGCIRLGRPNPYGAWIGRLRSMAAGAASGSNRSEARADPTPPSALLHRLLHRPRDLDRIAERRRRNYAVLYAGLRNLRGIAVPTPAAEEMRAASSSPSSAEGRRIARPPAEARHRRLCLAGHGSSVGGRGTSRPLSEGGVLEP